MLTFSQSLIIGAMGGIATAIVANLLNHRLLHQRWLTDKRAQIVDELIDSLEKCSKELSYYFRLVSTEAVLLPVKKLDSPTDHANQYLEPTRDKIGHLQTQWGFWFRYDVQRHSAWFEENETVREEIRNLGQSANELFEELFMLAESIRSLRHSEPMYTDENFRKVADGPRTSDIPRFSKRLEVFNDEVSSYQQSLVDRLRNQTHYWRRFARFKLSFERAFRRFIAWFDEQHKP